MIPGQVERLAIERSAERVRSVLPEVVDGWGGKLATTPDGARVEIPALAGLRRGRVGGTVRIEPAEAGAVASFAVETAALGVNVAACAILLLSVVGALVSMAWPWFPRLLPAVPLGLVLAVGGWLLIASRLRTSGPEEFLASLRQAALLPAEVEGPGDRGTDESPANLG